MGYGLPEWLQDVPPPEFVTCEQALRLQDRGEGILIDCRDAVGLGNGPGHAEGAPEGSINIAASLTMMMPHKVQEIIHKLKTEKPDATLILMSNTGMRDGPQAGRCKYVAVYLHIKKLWEPSKIVRLEGGLRAWQEVGFPWK